MKKDAQLTIRLSANCKAEIGEAAKNRDRSRNWLVESILEAWLRKNHRRRKTPKPS